jgi:uncharacterized protein with PIN domain
MTIREYLRGRTRLIRPLLFAWITLIALSMIVFPDLTKRWGVAWVLAWSLPAIAVLYRVFARIRCPRCNASLRSVVNTLINAKARPQIDFCPHCGVSFDEPIESPANAK